MTDYGAEIRAFILDRFLFGEAREIRADLSLLDAGILDSTGVLELVSYMENRYGIKVEDDELVPENLDSIDGLCAFLGRKKHGR
jgi:acyl carrier protein